MDQGVAQMFEQIANQVLIWVGFGTLVGLLAKAIMPGRDPGDAVMTVLMGVSGSVVGCGVLALLGQNYRVTPISVIGFVVATGVALILLGFYRLMLRTVLAERMTARRVAYRTHRRPRNITVHSGDPLP